MVLLPWPVVWVLAGQNGWGEQTTDNIYSGAIGVLQVWKNAFWAHQCSCNLPETNGDLSWGPQSPLVYHLSRWHSHLLQGPGQSPQETWGSIPEIGADRTKIQAFKVWTILVAVSLSGTCHFCPRGSHWWRKNWGYQELAYTHKHHGGPKFFGAHGILPQIHPYVHAGGMASAQINIRQKCRQEEGYH